MPPQNFPPPSSVVKMTTVDCSCNGDNPNCFRCDGRGYYERAATPSAPAKPMTPTSAAKSIVRHEHDSRGGNFALRENGRFLSNPEYDNHDDESNS